MVSGDGWIVNGPPKSSHRVAPLALTPRPGTSTATSKTTEPTKAGYASSRNARTGALLATISSGRPRPTHNACFSTIANDTLVEST